MGLLGSIMKIVNWVKEENEKAKEEAKYNTTFYLFELKQISKLAVEYNIDILSKKNLGWEEYDKKLLQIKNLDLSNKGLTTFPYELFTIIEKNEPYSISLKGNKIEDIPSEFNELCKYTKKLNLSHNRISFIGKDFFRDYRRNDSTRVIKLDLSFNKIEDIPFNLRFDYRLQNLNLSNNNINSLDSLCKNLKYLDLSNNKLRKISFNSTEHLEVLKINDNNISVKLPFNLKKILQNKQSSFENNPICNNSNPFEEETISSSSKSNAYINHCFSCGVGIDSRKDTRCSNCNFYICSKCGSCFCKY